MGLFKVPLALPAVLDQKHTVHCTVYMYDVGILSRTGGATWVRAAMEVRS